ncbi:hypothetical protein DV20_28815 [Amycolatopsis rifamycinica]|uniref:Uncharacterized protein n=1 Tax=Amycolatopsis rifamycinica TaxID=287986 RepID=A0A066TYD6_9PSEU|nr:hypothetical protein DV20_28815 [Amycolatopsis rifamycinica]
MAVGGPCEEIEKAISARPAPGEPAKSFAGWGIEHAVVITAGSWSPAGAWTRGWAAALIARVRTSRG